MAKQTAELKYWINPTYDFKDAVDGQLQQSLSAPNPLNDLSCILVTKSTHLKIFAQTAELKYLKDPSNALKDAVEGQFKQSLSMRVKSNIFL